MAITVKLHGSLKNFAYCDVEGICEINTMDGKSLCDLIEYLKISYLDFGFCAVNKKIVPITEIKESNVILQSNDYVEIFTAMKGG